MNLLDAPTVQEFVRAVNPKFVFHLAGRVTARQDRNLVQPMLADNLQASLHLFSALLDTPCRDG